MKKKKKIDVLEKQILKLQSELNEMTLQFQEIQIKYILEKQHFRAYKSICDKVISEKNEKNN